MSLKVDGHIMIMYYHLVQNSKQRSFMSTGRMVIRLCWSVLLPGVMMEGRAETLPVVAGTPPVAGLVRRIGGEWVSVETLLPAGANPHLFEPTPRQIAALSGASIFFGMGLPFEKRCTDKLPVRARPILADVGKDVPRRAAEFHEHEAGESCSNEETDPHIWFSLRNLVIMAEAVARELMEADPDHAEDYRQNSGKVIAELVERDETAAAHLEPFRGRAFFVYHPAYGYFAADYGLRQVAVEIEGREPAPRQLARMMKQAQAENIRVLFTSPQFSQAGAQAMARAIHGDVVLVDSLGEDIPHQLHTMAEAIARSYSTEPPPPP